MSLDDICALYSFPPPKFDGPTFAPLPAMDSPLLDPYARPQEQQKRPSLYPIIPVCTPPKEPFIAIPFSDGTQLHLHNDCGAGAFQDKKSKSLRYPLDAYQSAMADYYAKQVELPTLDLFCNKKKPSDR